MNDLLHVPPLERGVIRLFSLDMDQSDIDALHQPTPGQPAPNAAVAHLLGQDWFADGTYEIFPISDLEGLGLAGYLTEGNAIPEDQIDHHLLDTITGTVLIVYSRAFQDEPADLAPTRQVLPIAAFTEPGTDWSGSPIQTQSALPGSGVSPPARTPRRNPWGSLMVALMLTVVVALIYVVLS